MSQSDLDDREEDLSKKDRLINAWLAAGPETYAKTVAEIAGASTAYASRIKSQIEEGEITDDDVEDIRDEELVNRYTDRLSEMSDTGEADTDEAATAETETEAPAADADADAESASEPESEPGDEVDEGAGEAPGDEVAAAGTTAAEDEQAQSQAQAPVQDEASGQQQSAPQQGQATSQQRQQPPGAVGSWQTQSRQPQQDQQVQQGLAAADVDVDAVPVDQLQELDSRLATYEESARFELQHLPPQQTGHAVGKLFIIQQTRSFLHDAIGGESDSA